ncbi:hypothetical protein BA022_16495 [Diaphorobacter nitroreducens]|nr:hypothetical protein BA022_16495 [Diaphorobacter nitroreducens]
MFRIRKSLLGVHRVEVHEKNAETVTSKERAGSKFSNKDGGRASSGIGARWSTAEVQEIMYIIAAMMPPHIVISASQRVQ